MKQDLLPPERDARDRMLQLASQLSRHLTVHTDRIALPGKGYFQRAV